MLEDKKNPDAVQQLLALLHTRRLMRPLAVIYNHCIKSVSISNQVLPCSRTVLKAFKISTACFDEENTFRINAMHSPLHFLTFPFSPFPVFLCFRPENHRGFCFLWEFSLEEADLHRTDGEEGLEVGSSKRLKPSCFEIRTSSDAKRTKSKINFL